jgi:hypothetical protein
MQSVTPINTPNTTTAFVPVQGGWELRKIAMKASQAIADGCAVAVEVSGSSPTGYACLMPTTTSSGQNFVGILAEKIATTDADYATAGKLKSVWVPVDKTSEAVFTVGSGTFTAADVGRVCQFYSDSASLAVDTNGLGAIITKYISATKGQCSFNVPNAVTA